MISIKLDGVFCVYMCVTHPKTCATMAWRMCCKRFVARLLENRHSRMWTIVAHCQLWFGVGREQSVRCLVGDDAESFPALSKDVHEQQPCFALVLIKRRVDVVYRLLLYLTDDDWDMAVKRQRRQRRVCVREREKELLSDEREAEKERVKYGGGLSKDIYIN